MVLKKTCSFRALFASARRFAIAYLILSGSYGFGSGSGMQHLRRMFDLVLERPVPRVTLEIRYTWIFFLPLNDGVAVWLTGQGVRLPAVAYFIEDFERPDMSPGYIVISPA